MPQMNSKNSLLTRRPDVAAQWHKTKNGNLRPQDLAAGSGRKAWWQCPKSREHVWIASLINRTYHNSGCPFCAGLRVTSETCLVATAPEIAAQWHRNKNGSLTPRDIGPGSNRKVWWQCPKSREHVWLVAPNSRTRQNSGCPFCAGRRVARDTSLAAKAPQIAAQWHKTKNGSLTPKDVTVRSGRKVWWRCPRDAEHAWEARVADRPRYGCPYCSGLKVLVSSSLAARFPKLAREWHPKKNGKLRPRDVGPGSSRKVWWRCSRDRSHEWQAVINKRSSGHGCRFCSGRAIARNRTNSLAVEAPKIAREWHPTKNRSLMPSGILAGSHRRVWWKCPKGPDHEWEAPPSNRFSTGRGCPFCAGQRVSVTNALAAVRPDLAAEWHPTKNGKLTPWGITAGAHKMVWWRCKRNPSHQWSTTVHSRRGCPFCRHYRRTTLEDSLAKRMPHVAEQWHPTRNGALRPENVVPGSNRRVWWKCPKGPDHEWITAIVSRTTDHTGCPFCSNRRLSKTNNLAARYPELAKQWHPFGNGTLKPADFTPARPLKVWWKCPKGPDHEWEAPVTYRTRLGLGCPFCSGRKLSVTNSLGAKYPRIAAQWHPWLNGDLTADRIFSSSTTVVWWRCDRGHEWRATPHGRVGKSGGCPICPRTRKQRQALTRRVREVVRFPGDFA